MSLDLFCKFVDLEKGINEAGETTYRGIVSSTKVDYDNERMSKKALYGLQKDLLANTSVYFNHRYEGLAVAKTATTWVQEDGGEAYLWAEFIPTKARGPIDSTGVLVESVVQQLQEGTLKCLSVGGKKITEYPDTKTAGVTVLDEVKGLEYSLVGIGANPDAMMKTFAKGAYIKSLESRLNKSDGKYGMEVGGPLDATAAPIVAPVKQAVKDKQKLPEHKNEFDATYYKGEDMDVTKSAKCGKCGYEHSCKEATVDVQKENGPSTPNHPALNEAIVEDIVSRVLARIKASSGPVSGDSHSKSASVEMPPSAEKSVKEDEMVEKMAKRLEDAVSKAISSPKGLVVQEGKFDAVNAPASVDVNTEAVNEFSKMLAKE